MSSEATAVESTGPDMPPVVGNMVAEDFLNDEALREQALLGIEKLRRMSHDELKALISHRVELLQTEIKDREARQSVIEEAQLASRVLTLRRARARRLATKVNVGSSLVAAAFVGFMVISMIP